MDVQHISFLALRHTVTPTNITSNTFNNTIREWCFIASTNGDNMYEMTESVIYTASVISQAAARLAGFEAGSGSDLVVVFPSSLTLMIVNVDGMLGRGGCVSCVLLEYLPSCAHHACAAGA